MACPLVESLPLGRCHAGKCQAGAKGGARTAWLESIISTTVRRSGRQLLRNHDWSTLKGAHALWRFARSSYPVKKVEVDENRLRPIIRSLCLDSTYVRHQLSVL